MNNKIGQEIRKATFTWGVFSGEGLIYLNAEFPEDMREEEAIVASIDKWKEIEAAARGFGRDEIADGGGITCGLCHLYHRKNCSGCPVASKTGARDCKRTPYYHGETPTQATDMREWLEEMYEEWREAREKEVEEKEERWLEEMCEEWKEEVEREEERKKKEEKYAYRGDVFVRTEGFSLGKKYLVAVVDARMGSRKICAIGKDGSRWREPVRFETVDWKTHRGRSRAPIKEIFGPGFKRIGKCTGFLAK